MSSPTSQPPASRAMFQLRPQSLRLTFAFAVNPTWRPPRMPGVVPRNSTSKVTGFVTPRIVTSAVTAYVPSSFGPTLVVRTAIHGWVSTSKESAGRRCGARAAVPAARRRAPPGARPVAARVRGPDAHRARPRAPAPDEPAGAAGSPEQERGDPAGRPSRRRWPDRAVDLQH